MIGLIIVASAVTSTFFILSALISAQSESAWLINISGRQRMLSQRIALHTVQLAREPQPSRATTLRDELDHDLALMLSSHEALVAASGGRERMSAELRTLYFDRIDAVDPAVQAFSRDVRALLAMDGQDERIEAADALTRRAKSSLLNGLNAVVLQLQVEAEARIRFLERLEFAVYLVTLLGLAAEAIFVFRPTLQELHRRARELDLLSYQASHDELTGLPNRRYFLDFADTTLAVAARKGHHTGVLHIDLDGFKSVNDHFGHAVGDEVLRWVAHRLRDTVRGGDFLARLGGDEFVLLVADVKSALELERSAARLLDALEASPQPPSGAAGAGASIGLALMAPGERSIEPLLQQSDRALYRAKSAGKAQWSWSTHQAAPSPEHG
ncbi:MAG: diguanylate cyclase [Pseudomonadota bacterium]